MKFGKKKALCFGLFATQLISLVALTSIMAFAGTSESDSGADISSGTSSETSSSTPSETSSGTSSETSSDTSSDTPVDPQTPLEKTATPSIYIDYVNKKLRGFLSDVTYSGVNGTIIDGACEIPSGAYGNTIEIIAKANGKKESDVQQLVIPKVPKAPVVEATYPQNGYVRLYNPFSVTSVDNLMYRIGNKGEWMNYYNGSEIGAGSLKTNDVIQVKYAATLSSFESEEDSVRVNSNNKAQLSFTAPVFENLEYEYFSYDYKPITIKNFGPGDAYIKSIKMDYGFFYVYNEMTTVKGGSVNTDISIAPAPGLSVGSFTSKLTITYTDNSSTVEKTFVLPVTIRVVPRKIPAYTEPKSVNHNEISEGGTPVTFLSESGAISKISLAKTPSGYIKDSVGIRDNVAFFQPNAVVGDYVFEVIPVDFALYQRNYVTVSVVNEQYNPEIAKNTAQLSDKIKNAKAGDTIKVATLSTITSAQVKDAAAKGLHFEVKVNNKYSWNISTSKLSDKKSALNLSLKDETIPTADTNKAVFGKYSKVTGLTVSASCGNGGVLNVKTGYSSTKASPVFANLYKYNSKGILEFQKAVLVDEKGTAAIPVEKAGKYAIVMAKETKLVGDMDNSCKVNSNDALMILRLIVSGEKVTPENTPKAAFARKKTVSSADALAVLKYIVQQ